MSRTPTLACSNCDRPMWDHPRIKDLYVRNLCRPCRREARPEPRPAVVKTCAWCSRSFTAARRTQIYCTASCREAKRSTSGSRFHTMSRGNTADRGYGHEHAKARQAAMRRHKPSDPCTRCGLPLGPMSSHLHYDHNRDRTGYLGFAHAECNRLAGAREGRRRQRQTRRRRLL